jgi:hypothetical protein
LARADSGMSLSLRHNFSQVAGPPAIFKTSYLDDVHMAHIVPILHSIPVGPQISLTKGIWHYNGFSAVSNNLSQQHS